VRVVVAVDGYVDLVAGLGRGIVDCTGGDAGRVAAVRFGGGVPAGPFTAEGFEVGAEDLAAEGGLGALPDGGGAAGTFEVAPVGAHDGVVEGDEGFGDAVGGAVAAEGVGFVADETHVFEDVEGVGEVGGFAAEVVGDAAACGVAVGDGGQDGVVERGVMEVGLFGEEVAGFAEEGAGGVEDGAGDPVVEVVGAGRGVALGEFAAVSGGAADDGVGEGGGMRVGDVPELGGKAVVQGGDHELEAGSAA